MINCLYTIRYQKCNVDKETHLRTILSFFINKRNVSFFSQPRETYILFVVLTQSFELLEPSEYTNVITM